MRHVGREFAAEGLVGRRNLQLTRLLVKATEDATRHQEDERGEQQERRERDAAESRAT